MGMRRGRVVKGEGVRGGTFVSKLGEAPHFWVSLGKGAVSDCAGVA